MLAYPNIQNRAIAADPRLGLSPKIASEPPARNTTMFLLTQEPTIRHDRLTMIVAGGLLLCLLWHLCGFVPSAGGQDFPDGTSLTDYAGYTDCVKLENEHTTVVLGHHAGGRVLAYTWQGKNALYLNPDHDGWDYGGGSRRIDPSGGRFDIGPEQIIPRHPSLWLGPWTAEVTGPRRARLVSTRDTQTGIQLTRTFALDETTSHLVCTQTILNVTSRSVAFCHWGRTLAQGGGIVLIPLTEGSRFPAGYLLYGPGPVMNYRPADPNIRRRDGFLEVLGPPKQKKLGLDTTAGWFGYLMATDILFVKQFPGASRSCLR